LRQLTAPHGWGNPAGRVNTPTRPVLPLEGAGRAQARAFEWTGTKIRLAEWPLAVQMGSIMNHALAHQAAFCPQRTALEHFAPSIS